jgi:hypothetical protein
MNYTTDRCGLTRASKTRSIACLATLSLKDLFLLCTALQNMFPTCWHGERNACCGFTGERTDLMNSPDDWRNNIDLEKWGWTNLKDAFYNRRKELIDLLEGRDDSFM